MLKWILALVLATFFTHAFPNEEMSLQKHKTYVTSDQILIMPHGIFCVDVEGFTRPVRFLSHDENGLFMVDDFIQCPACGAWSEDGSIHQYNCPFKRK